MPKEKDTEGTPKPRKKPTPPRRRPESERPGPEPDNPWDRLREESDKAWASFVTYRDMPPLERSVRRTSRIIGLRPPTIHAQASKFSWIARARAYDVWKDRQAQIAEIEAITEMKKRHISIAMNLQGAAALALQKIIAAEKTLGPDGRPGPLTLRPSEVKDLAELGMKIERLNRGEPESLQSHRVELEAHDKRQELRKLLESPKASEAVHELADRMLDEIHGQPRG